jgi:hypothetical protein
MMRVVVLALVIVVVYALPASAALRSDWAFKTPGGSTYCRYMQAAWECVTPRDGFWIRFTFTRIHGTDAVDVRKGSSARLRGLRDRSVSVLGFGRTFSSSDADVITCRSRSRGLTCRHYGGLSFWLGRTRGHRIYWDAPGFRPDVSRPLFKTDHDLRCGIARSLEPSSPSLTCWRASDGLELGIAHDDAGRRGGHGRNEKALGYRPAGFRAISYGSVFEWRCRDVTAFSAERCSTREGTAVFTCTNTRARLTCRNRNGHGFWASARSFYTF